MQAKVSRVFASTLLRNLSHLPKSPTTESSAAAGTVTLTHFSTSSNRPIRGDRGRGDRSRGDRSEEHFLRNLNFGNDGQQENGERNDQNPPNLRPRRPLRGNQRSDFGSKDGFPNLSDEIENPQNRLPNRALRGNKGPESIRGEKRSDFGLKDDYFGLGDRQENPPNRMPNRPLRGNQTSGPRQGERRSDFGSEDDFLGLSDEQEDPPNRMSNRPLRGNRRSGPIERVRFDFESEDDFPDLDDEQEKVGGAQRNSCRQTREGRETSGHGFESLRQRAPSLFAEDGPRVEEGDRFDGSGVREKGGDRSSDTLFQKLNLDDTDSRGRVEETKRETSVQNSGTESEVPETPLEDADEIFRKMKETGLIPNAVAMLDGLCKDGLIQEAMKLFGLMREKGTIPEVVIYTAVVEGFFKAGKIEDAKRIFRKMQKNGIVPNAFSYTIIIQGLCKGGRLQESVEFCNEMLDAGQFPNPATFTGLVDGFCKEKGVEEASSVVRSLRERGFAVDERAVREYLDKKGPNSPMVWEAIFGKKESRRPF